MSQKESIQPLKIANTYAAKLQCKSEKFHYIMIKTLEGHKMTTTEN